MPEGMESGFLAEKVPAYAFNYCTIGFLIGTLELGNLMDAILEVDGSKSNVRLRVGSYIFRSALSAQHALPIVCYI